MENKKHIFLSYSRIDSKFALQLADDLKSCDIKIWVDQIDIPDGKHWDNTIEEALDNSCALILVISPSSASSDRVKDEVSYAQDNDIHIFPIIYKETKVPLGWRRIQSVEIDDKNYHQKIEDFIKRIANFTSCDISEVNIKPKKPKRTWIKLTALFLVSLGAYSFYDINKKETLLSQEHVIKKEPIKKVIAKKPEKKEITISKKVEQKVITKEDKVIEKIVSEVAIKKIKTIKTIEEPKHIVVVEPVVQKIKKVKKQKESKPKKVVKVVSEIEDIQEVDEVATYTEPTKPKRREPTISPLSSSDPYADIFNRYLTELQRDNKTKLIIISHGNKNNEYDTAQNRAYAVSLDLRERGLKREMIKTKVKLDTEDRVTYDFRRVVR